MAKIYGLFGAMSGKMADTVMAVRNGVQIVRKYQPVVDNPKSPAQSQARAKLKLLSQLGAAMAPVIAMTRVASVSSRNMFTKKNYEYVGYADGEASINLADILLTNSMVGMAGFTADRSGGDAIAVALSEENNQYVDEVVYIVVEKTASQTVRPIHSVVVSKTPSNPTFAAQLPYVEGDVAILMYGIRLYTTEARVVYGNLIAPTAEDVAKIIVSRTLMESDYRLTETRGLYMATGENTGATSGVALFHVGLSTSSYPEGEDYTGTVTGEGNFPMGTEVTVSAVPAAGAKFEFWVAANNPGVVVSSQASYTFKLTGNINLVAVFGAAV